MRLVKWQPRTTAVDPFHGFLSDFDRLFDFERSGGRSFARGWTPALDLSEHEDHYFVSVDLPGLTKEDVEIRLHDSDLTIRGERKQEQEKKENGAYHSERVYGKFERTLTLPVNVKADNVEATFKNGVLEVKLPKSEEARPRQIEIKAS